MRRIIHILPSLPPKITGVGDFGFILAEGLLKQYNIKSVFLISDSSYELNKLDNYEVYSFNKNYSSFYKELTRLISGGINNILLQYVNYAYQKRGIPFYVPLVLKRIKKEHKEVKLIINFHELYAKGNFPSSSFFLYPVQKKIFEQLVEVGDIFFTSMKKYGTIIKRADKTNSKAVYVLPVFSNVGELEEYIPLNARKNQLVIFGSKIQRLRTYKDNYNKLIDICNRFNLDKIIDIGEPTGLNLNNYSTVNIIETGKLTAEKISEYLSTSMAAAIYYPAAYLAKSGAFAAYAAHGLPVFCFADDNINEDGLFDGLNFISAKNFNNLNSLDVISKNVFDWYSNHSIVKNVEMNSSAINF